jgi:hypothetical protein
MAFLKPPEECTQIPGAFRKAICSSHTALEEPLTLQQEGLRKSAKILKHCARGKNN